jgi:hypothetical protein
MLSFSHAARTGEPQTTQQRTPHFALPSSSYVEGIGAM